VRHGSVSAEGQVLIAYDGSPDAARAITHAGALLPGRYATVLTVQRPVQPALAHPWKGAAFERQFEHLDTAAQEAAQARVAEGVELASAAGLDAQPLVCVADGPVWQKILHAADERDAGVVVLGSRGFGELQALLRHGVSSPALRHTHRPLLVVSHGATDAPVPLAAPTGEGSERPSP
jgi:nucleotide-binding universal stress UspA family protein